MRPVYLDNNATTPCAAEVIDAMLPYLREEFGNPGSPHLMGRVAAKAVANAREQIASCVGCEPTELFFTSGATESNNLVLLGLSTECQGRRGIAVSSVEHKAVLTPSEHLEESGIPVCRLPVGSDGIVDLDAMSTLVGTGTALVAVQAANNETGILQPISEIVARVNRTGALMHCDAAQILGKVAFSVAETGVDFAAFSAHKVYGPKGIGAVYVRAGLGGRLRPLAFGGGHEAGIRPGTLNVPGIVGFAVACRIACERITADADRISALRNLIEEELVRRIPGSRVNGADSPRLPGTTSITVPRVPADAMLANVPEVCFSSGAACTSGSVAPSHVLLAMGLSRDDADCTIRLCVGRQNTSSEIQTAIELIASAACRLRQGFG